MITPSVTQSFAFPDTLTEIGVYNADIALSDLTPADGYHPIDLASGLFSDSSKKSRLLYVPEGGVIEPLGDGVPQFPDGTVLVKTFYYDNDARDPSLGRRIIETRLLVLSQGSWNVATYFWNDAQTQASRELEGRTVPISWIDAAGRTQAIDYEVPDETTCVACHQRNETAIPLGPELRNLNIEVERSGQSVNQLAYLTEAGALMDLDPSTVAAGVDYLDASLPISDRGRAYLDMNCSHCHNPLGWDRPANQGLDLRIEVPLESTGISQEARAIQRQFRNGSMPFFGTVTIDQAGLDILSDYLSG